MQQLLVDLLLMLTYTPLHPLAAAAAVDRWIDSQADLKNGCGSAVVQLGKQWVSARKGACLACGR
jgi:hypothetical protein